MRIIAAAFLVAICVGHNRGQDLLQEGILKALHGVCRLMSFVDDDLVLAVRAGNFTSEDIALKKYCFCVYRHLNMMDDNATILVENALKILPEKTDKVKFKEAVEKCKSVQGYNTDDTAYKRLRCYNEQYPNDIVAL